MKNEQKKENPGDIIITPAGPMSKEHVHLVNKDESLKQNNDGSAEILKASETAPVLSSIPEWIPEDHIITPGGLRNKSLVHLVEAQQILDGSGGGIKKLDRNGKLMKDFGPVVRKPLHQALMPSNITLPEKQVPGLGTGWIVYTDWTNKTGTPVSSFETTWVVPPAPATNAALIYIFNGIQNSTMIYQPVLQWGNNGESGGHYWQVASWYADGKDGDAHHSSYIPVSPGDILVGIITLTAQNGTNFNYNCEFRGIANSGFAIQNVEELTWCIETLEAYNVNQASDYPVRKIVMSNINLQTGNTSVAVNWHSDNAVTDTGQEAVVINNSSLNEEVDLYCYTIQQLSVAQNADGRLELFYTSINDALYHVWQAAPNSGWVTDEPLGDNNAAKQLCVGSNSDGRLEVFYVGTNDKLYHNWQVSPNGGWSGEHTMGGTAKQVMVGKNADGRLEIFYLGTNDHLYHNWQVPGGWSGESELGGMAKQIAVGNNLDGRLELFYVGTDNKIYHNWQTAPNGNWGGEAAMGGAAKQVIVDKNADGRLELFYVGTNDAIYHNWQAVPNGGWSGEASMGGLAKQLHIGKNADGRLELFYIGTDDNLYHNWQTAVNNGWNGEAAIGGAAKQIALAANADGRLEIFYAGTNNVLYHNWQTGPNEGWIGEQRM
ncbi:MAG: hypothetical protein ABI707_01115 [Ferruginibacter sp.]